MIKRALIIVSLIVFTLFSSSSWADQCESDDREPLPDCVANASSSKRVNVTNNCDFMVTIKVDISEGSDVREDLDPGENEQFNLASAVLFIGGRIRGIYCCPNYSRCKTDEDHLEDMMDTGINLPGLPNL